MVNEKQAEIRPPEIRMYRLHGVCDNCGKEQDMDVPFGLEWYQVQFLHKCIECGCTRIRKEMFRQEAKK